MGCSAPKTPSIHYSITPTFYMSKIRVLVVDDSAVIRRLVSDVINGDPALEVAGVAANGRLAQECIEQLKPDLVTMDVEMPEMDGVQAVKELRKKHPRLPVIMFSYLTQRGVVTTMDALAAGASDYVAKPANVSSASAGRAQVRDELIPKIKALCGLRESLTASASFPKTESAGRPSCATTFILAGSTSPARATSNRWPRRSAPASR